MNTKILFCGSILLMLFFSSCRQTEEGNHKRIAIVTPLTHPSLEQIEKGFIETLLKDPHQTYSTKTFNAQGSKSLLRGEIEEISRGNYDLIFAICATPAKMAKEVFERKNVATPIVYAAVIDPKSLNLIQSEEASGNQLTGTIELMDYEKLFDEVLPHIGNIKNLLLVYDPTQWYFDRYLKQLKALLPRRSIELQCLEIFRSSEIPQKVPVFLSNADAVLILKDNTVVSGLDSLLKLTKKRNIPLIASDLDSPLRGVDIAYGVREYEYGRKAAQQAMKIINEGIAPSELPSIRVDEFELVNNLGGISQ